MHESPRPGLCAFAAASILVCGVAGSAGAGDVELYRGRPLVTVLQELRDEGLELIFSSAVVSEEAVVSVEPASADPRKILDEILAPLGLVAEDGPGTAILVVPDDREEPPEPFFSTEVIVTPGRHSLRGERAEASRTIDRADQLLVPNIGGDISRVVERLPGVAAADNSAAFHSRGGLTIDTSFVLDGLELYEPFHLESFQSPFSLIDSQVVDQIEFLGGGLTADYGDRHGGFVEVSTVTAKDEGRGEIELGTLNSRVSYGAPFNGGAGSWLLTVRGWYPESLLDTLEQGGGDKIRPRFGDAYAKLYWSLSPRTLISFHGLFAYDELTFQEQGEEDNENVDATTQSGYVWGRWLESWSPRISSDTVLSVGRINSTRAGIAAPDDGLIAVDDARDVEFVGLTHDTSWQIADAHLLKGGLYARDLRAEYHYVNLVLNDPGASLMTELEPVGSSVGLYAAYRARVSPAVATEFGIRWDRQDYTDDNQLSPRFNLLWRIDERSDFRFAVGRYQQSQRIHELRVEDGETEFQPAEISSQAELTFQHRFGAGWRLRLDAYYRRLTDLRPRYENLYQPIDLFPETSEERVEVAPDEARLRGIELLLSEDGDRPLTWWVSYTYSSAEDLIEGGYVPRSWDQPHAAKFLVGYRWADRWFLSLSGTAHTGWPTTPWMGDRNSARFPTYARLDLKARRSFDLSGSRLSLTLDVINVTDRENICCVDDFLFHTGDDGSVVAEPEYAFWLGFTPSFSILWEF